jgi:hypothetical protein
MRIIGYTCKKIAQIQYATCYFVSLFEMGSHFNVKYFKGGNLCSGY